MIADEPERPWSSRAINSYRPADAFHEITSCGGALPINVCKINGKIQRAEQMKVHTKFVIEKRDMDANAVSVRIHGKGNLGAKPHAEAIADLLRAVAARSA